MSSDLDLSQALDSLVSEGERWLWKTRLRNALRLHLPRTLLLLLVVPLVAVLVVALGWMFGVPLGLPWWLIILAFPIPAIVFLCWRAFQLWQNPCSRGESLSVFDERFGLNDRLQTADEFLAMQEKSPFMDAALNDAQSAVQAAVTRPLDWKWGEPWGELKRLSALPLLAFLLVVGVLFLPLPKPVGAASQNQATAMQSKSIDSRLLPPPEESPVPDPDEAKLPVRRAEEPAEARAKISRTSKAVPVLEKNADNPSPQLAGREKISLGESEGGQSSQTTSSGRSSQSRGMPGSQSPSSKRDKNPSKPKKKREPKEPKADKKSDKDRKKLEEKSGATAGRGSSSGSSRNPASTDWSSKDRTEETDNEEFEDEEDVDDEDTESDARGGLQPNLRDRRPPVNRDLSIGFGNRSNPDANGRGGPGQRKKSRGVAALVLGVPVPDHVKGQPNPGRVKINQERVQPQAEELQIVDAEERGRRSLPTGWVPQRTLDAAMRQVVRDYFLKAREKTQPEESAPDEGL